MKGEDAADRSVPSGEAPSPAPDAGRGITCPWCRGDATERIAEWGSLHLIAQYYCRECRTVFDVVRES